MYYCGAAWVLKGHGAVSLLCVGVIGVEGHGTMLLLHVGVVGVEGHGAVSLRRVGVVGVDGPWDRVAVEVAQCRVVTLHGCRRCRSCTMPRGCQRATALCHYTAWVSSVSMGHGSAWPSKWHDTAWVSKGHGAVSSLRISVVGVEVARRCMAVEGPQRHVVTATWVSLVSMGHGSMLAIEVAQRRMGVDGPQRRVTVIAPQCRMGVKVPRRVRLHP
ncbi:hypothetical protein EDB89DRAFT_1912661 [Lactarius sanguifluus]|nr:hypothetical protein EDB89DRAFT_1912661 [Lactarius sanguifluus]